MRNRRVPVAAAVMSILLAGCGSDAATPTTSSPEPSTTAAAEPAAEPVSPLDGTWRTRPVSQADAEATLRRHGLAQWIERFRPLTPFAADTVLILNLEQREWDLYGKSKGGPREEIDYDAAYDVDGATVVVTHATGSTTFRWSVDGDTLTLEWLSSTQPPYRGIPDEVFQRALYMTRGFEKQT